MDFDQFQRNEKTIRAVHNDFKVITCQKDTKMTVHRNIPTKMNPVQLHLLELFSRKMGELELLEIKELLVQYYKAKVELEVEEFWNKKGFSKDSWNEATRDVQHGTLFLKTPMTTNL